MFNVFSAAFLDNNSNNFNNGNKPINSNINKSNNLTRSISANVNNENDRSKNLPLKDRLATVRNVQNILNKKNLNKPDETNNSGNNKGDENTNASGGNNNGNANDAEKNAASSSNAHLSENAGNAANAANAANDGSKAAPSTVENHLSKFKNYSSVVNEKQNEELEKKLKKRKRRRKHVILMERMKQKEKDKKRHKEMGSHDNNDDDEEEGEEDENEERTTQKVVGRRGRPSKRSQNKLQQKVHQEEEDEEGEDNDEGDEDDEKEGKHNRKSKGEDAKFSKKFSNSGDSTGGKTYMDNTSTFRRNTNDNNEAGMKPKRKRRKKKEMEEYRARLLKEKMQQQNSLSSVLTKTNSFNNHSNANNSNNNNNENNSQGEVKVKRKRGRPKLSEVAAMNNANDKMKQNDIRKYYSKNSDHQSMNRGDGGAENEEENKNVLKLINTSIQENNSFMKKSPTEIIELEKIYKNNIKKGVTCIPLNYQSRGGGMALILIGTQTTYGPVKNTYGFMTFLILDCDSNNFFIDTGMKSNAIECEKHMQLLISPGDMYMFKNQSQEVEVRLLLIVCNKMNEPFDAKLHIKDPEINVHK